MAVTPNFEKSHSHMAPIEHLNKLSLDLAGLLRPDQPDCNVRLRAGTGQESAEFYAHHCVLRARSAYFLLEDGKWETESPKLQQDAEEPVSSVSEPPVDDRVPTRTPSPQFSLDPVNVRASFVEVMNNKLGNVFASSPLRRSASAERMQRRPAPPSIVDEDGSGMIRRTRSLALDVPNLPFSPLSLQIPAELQYSDEAICQSPVENDQPNEDDIGTNDEQIAEDPLQHNGSESSAVSERSSSDGNQSPTFTSKTHTYDFPHISAAALGATVGYLYTGVVDLDRLPMLQVLDVLQVAIELFVDELVQSVEDYIIEHSDDWDPKFDITTRILQVVSNGTCLKLREHVIWKIASDPVWFMHSSSFLNVDESTLEALLKRHDLVLKEIEVWDALVRWTLARTPERLSYTPISQWLPEDFEIFREIIQPFLQFIRFFDIKSEVYLEKVKPYQALPRSLQDQLYRHHITSRNDNVVSRNALQQLQDNCERHRRSTYSVRRPVSSASTVSRSLSTPVPPSPTTSTSLERSSPNTARKRPTSAPSRTLSPGPASLLRRVTESKFYRLGLRKTRDISPEVNTGATGDISVTSSLINTAHAMRIERWIRSHDIRNIDGDATLDSTTTTSYTWTLLYRASRDGFKSSDFHERCDDCGPTVTLVRPRDNDVEIIGGYNSNSWSSPAHPQHRFSENNFVFAFDHPAGLGKVARIKPEFRRYASHDSADCGPQFPGGLLITSDCRKEKGSRAGPELKYFPLQVTEERSFLVDDYEVFSVHPREPVDIES